MPNQSTIHIGNRKDAPASEFEPVVLELQDIPASLRALGTLADADYLDAFTLSTNAGPKWSPDQWAHAAFEDVAGLGGQFIWRVLLGMRLAWRRSSAHIAGWRIVGHGDDWIRLEAHSWMLVGQLVIRLKDHQVTLLTIIRYDRPLAATIWQRLSVKHRGLAPGLLRGTLAKLTAGSHD
ncbi:hypothetical protein [Nocardia brasiliensis]|uniref:DUF2867 domain-containing protein n=1 Tax=Nocardia brasiliensis (strain ATCC 700358 / HUJEG-1) TaxID=1133849 RepID=K0EPA6_NOCB7|nr:hypothetical protein [Nocardia brasiliensis]AFT98813.1 hypothetical protein O3I_004255 [Nocardia brasiliensis ATCC 700358]OCF89077.1 hypothetical protein AW168_19190 [Nocardia brasiliensis]